MKSVRCSQAISFGQVKRFPPKHRGQRLFSSHGTEMGSIKLRFRGLLVKEGFGKQFKLHQFGCEKLPAFILH